MKSLKSTLILSALLVTPLLYSSRDLPIIYMESCIEIKRDFASWLCLIS